MTLAEIKPKIALLTKKEREELLAYLHAQEQAESAEWRAKITQRARRLEKGEGVPIQTVHRQPSAQLPA